MFDVLDIKYILCDGLRLRRRTYWGNVDVLDINCVKSLLEIYPGYLHLHDRDGMNPFELACQFASVDIVQYMLELDDKIVDHVDEWGNTPLHWACQSDRTFCNLEVVNYLLEKQMSLVTIPNKNGDLPIHVAGDNMKKVSASLSRYEAEQIEIVWRLLLAYPDCLSCVGGSTSGSSNGKLLMIRRRIDR